MLKHYDREISCLLVALSLVFIIGCSENPDSRILAKVNNTVIRVGDLKSRISKLPPYYQSLANQNKKQFLDDMIGEIIFVQEAIKEGLNRDQTVKELITEARNKILVSKLINDKVDNFATITEDQIEEFYQKHSDEFIIPEKIRASHIMVDTEKKAEEILRRLKGGEDFAKLAREESQDTSKNNGGDIGYFSKGQMISEFEDACFKMQVGEIYGPVKTKLGFHIIKLTDKISEKPQDIAGSKERIRQELLKVARRTEFERFVETLKKKSIININESILNSLGQKPQPSEDKQANKDK